MTTTIEVKVLKLSPSAWLPTYAHSGPFGDLCADLRSLTDYIIEPGTVTRIPIGIAIELPSDYGAVVEDRSGLATKGICTLGGVIDPGYRGEIQILLTNTGPDKIVIQRGDRIAQLRLIKRITANFVEVSKLNDTERGSGGFGSTGS